LRNSSCLLLARSRLTKGRSSGSVQARPAISADFIVAEIEQDVEFLPRFRPKVEWRALVGSH